MLFTNLLVVSVLRRYGVSMVAVSVYFTRRSILLLRLAVSVLRRYGVSMVAVSVYFTRRSILLLRLAVSVLRRYGVSMVAVSVYFTRRSILLLRLVVSVLRRYGVSMAVVSLGLMYFVPMAFTTLTSCHKLSTRLNCSRVLSAGVSAIDTSLNSSN